MRRQSAWACLLAALCACLPLSCFKSSTHNNSIKRNPPTDPLLQSKCPVQARYGTTTDIHPRPDPLAPAVPAGAWIMTPSQSQPHLGLDQPNPPAPFRWTSEKRDVASEGKPQFFEGKLEKAGEQWLLRNDRVPGGKLALEGHPRLDLFQPGDVVHVEGRLTQEAEPRSGGAWLPLPLFVVEYVRAVGRGE